MQRNAARRNDAAEHVVDQDEFVAGRIGVAQRGHVHVLGQLGPQQVDDVAVLLLDADDAALGADQFHAGSHAFDHGVGILAEHFFVFVQQGLALGGVEEQRIGLPAEFDVGGKAGAAGPHNSRLGNIFNGNMGHLKLLS